LSKVIAFDEAPPSGTINFGLGQPSAELLPIELVHAASTAFFDSADPLQLNYGPVAGDAAAYPTGVAGF